MVINVSCVTALLPEDSVTLTDEVSCSAQAARPPGSVDELLAVVRLLLSEGLVSRVGACFHFRITSGDGQCKSYYVDLSQGGWPWVSWVRNPQCLEPT